MRGPATPSALNPSARWNTSQYDGGLGGETDVDRGGREPECDKPELERGDVPADRAGGQFPLPEERPADRPSARRVLLPNPRSRTPAVRLNVDRPAFVSGPGTPSTGAR